MAETKLLGKSDEEEIWLTIRSVLTFARVVVLFGTIVEPKRKFTLNY